MADSQNTRLDRIEGKIDKLHEGFVSLARMEERIISLFKNTEATEKQISQLQASFNKRIDTLEAIVLDQSKIIFTNAQVTTRITKLFWAAMTAIPTGWVGLMYFLFRDNL